MFNNNLDPKLLHETLENLKSALNNYEKNFQNKTYKFRFEDGTNISMNIASKYLNHLLGFNLEFSNTWVEFISSKSFYSPEWLRDFANSEEFISYYIFARKQEPYINFSKVNYKASNFKNLDLKSNTAFLFEYPYFKKNVINLGIVNDDKIISLKLGNNGQIHYFAPLSLYVYDNDIADIKKMKNIQFPTSAKVKAKRMIELTELYSDELKEETLEKIKILSR